jgi:uncharacterized protein
VKYMREVEMQRMTPSQVAKLEADTKVFNKFNRKAFLGPLLANFLPWYDPAKKPQPRGLVEYLRRFEKGGEWSASAARNAAKA